MLPVQKKNDFGAAGVRAYERIDEVSVVLDAAAYRANRCAGDVWFLLKSQGEENMQVELMSCGIDRFDLESHAQAHSKEVDGLADGSRPFRLQPLNPDTAPLVIAFPFGEVRPHYFDRRRHDCGRTD
jgi:hypothetical protein